MAGEGSSVELKNEEEHEDGNEKAVSMVEILEEEKKLEEDANAVLGDSDDRNCTYLMGYVPRQALYACMTCVPKTMPPAGVCLACSFECHEGHELIELYTKRNFRCDCGNSKFGEFQCKLMKEKVKENEDNCYNQNFHGQYCTCERPYPDPEDTMEDEMIQCLACEDWFHGRHLLHSPPKTYDEMICDLCMAKHNFLWPYTVFCIQNKIKSVEADGTTAPKASGKPESDTKDISTSGGPKTEEGSGCKVEEIEVVKSDSCNYAALTKPETYKGPTYWTLDWRQNLCRCQKCMAMYEEKSMTFMLSTDDTVHAYEERGKQKRGTESDYDQGLKALSNMNRVQQVEVAQGYNDLKGELKDYLKKFAENGKVVREEDIKEFFSALQAKKRQRTGMQWACK